MRTIFRCRAALLAAAAVATATCYAPVLAWASAPPASHGQASKLVRQLGSPKFAERERAERELRTLAVDAKEALAAAANDPDAEVRTRARSILADVVDADFRARLEAFSADYDGARQRTLPGWERFTKLFGSGHLARQFFVEIARREPELMDAYAAAGNVAAEVVKARGSTVLADVTQGNGEADRLTTYSMAALLLVGSSEDVVLDDQFCGRLYTWMLYQPGFAKDARSGPWSPMMKKLLGRWIVKDADVNVTMQNLMFAASYELNPEGLSLAIKELTSDRGNAQLRQFALLAVGRFGKQEHLPLVEKYLRDSTTCGAVQLSKPPRQVDVQLRDVALAVAIHLADQDADDYGTVAVQSSPYSFFRVPALAFADAAGRDAAVARWAEFRAQPSKPK